MSKKRPRFADIACCRKRAASGRLAAPFVLVLLLGGAVAAAPPAPAADTDFRAAHRISEASAATMAGIEIGRLAPAGLRLGHRDDRAPGDGGSTLAFADDSGEVRAVVRFAVTADPAAARRFTDAELRGVSRPLRPVVDLSPGDFAFADADGAGESLVVGSVSNIAYSVRTLGRVDLRSDLQSAAAIAAEVRSLMVPGTPRWPEVALATDESRGSGKGAAVAVTATDGLVPRLRAEGGYLARGDRGIVVHPSGGRPVTLTAIAVDGLGRVTVARATHNPRQTKGVVP